MGPSKGTGGAKRRGLAEGCGSEEGCEREVRVTLVEESKSWAISCEAVQRFLPSINKRFVNTFLIIGSEVLETLLSSQLNSDSSNLKGEGRDLLSRTNSAGEENSFVTSNPINIYLFMSDFTHEEIGEERKGQTWANKTPTSHISLGRS